MVSSYLATSPPFPGKIFHEHFGVPRALFYRLLSDHGQCDSTFWNTQYDAIGRVGSDAAVTVLDFLKRLSTRDILRELKDGAERGTETIH